MNPSCPQCGAPRPAGEDCRRCMMKLAVSPTAPDDGGSDAPLKPGATFGGLEIVEVIGRGGMGVVYRARQTGLDRLVALKVLAPRLADDPEFAARFNREAKALASLNHPNIVHVHDFGRQGDVLFLVMELVDGVSLRELMHGDRPPPAEALKIVPQICEALEYAHAAGVVHRDIKPENILVDRSGRVKIADFGLAKLTLKPDAVATNTRAVMGTPHYMAPEQLESTRSVDHRADIYSLGVVFYELLTGDLPIGRFEPPSHRVAIDVRLDEVVLRALERRPTRRYQRASDVRTDIRTIATTSAGPRPIHAKLPEISFMLSGCVATIVALFTFFISRGARVPVALWVGPMLVAMLSILSASWGCIVLHRRGAAPAHRRKAVLAVLVAGLALITLTLPVTLYRIRVSRDMADTVASLRDTARDLQDVFPGTDRLLAQLDDESVPVREKAAHELVERGSKDPDLHRRILRERDADAGAERRGRLEKVAVEIDFRRARDVRPREEARFDSRSGRGPSVLALSPDGSRLATWGRDRRVTLVETGELREVGALGTTDGDVDAMEFSPDGRRLAVGAGRWVRLVDVASGEAQTFQLPHDVNSIAFSRDGRRLLVETDSTVQIMNAQSGEPEREWRAAISFQGADLSPDGESVAMLELGGRLVLGRAKDGETRALLAGGRKNYVFTGRSVLFDADGGRVACLDHSGESGEIVVVDARTGQEKRRIAPPGDVSSTTSLARIPGSKEFAVVQLERIRLYAWDDGSAVRELRERAAAVAFGAKGEAFIARDADLRKLAPVSGEMLARATTVPGRIQNVAFHADGKTLLVWDETLVRFWDWSRGIETRAWPLAGPESGRWALSQDGNLLAVADNGGVNLVDLRTGRSPENWERRPAVSVAFAPDGRLLLGGFSGDILVIDTTDGSRVRSIEAPKTLEAKSEDALIQTTAPRIHVAFSADGRFAARNFVMPLPEQCLDFVDLRTGDRLSALPREHVGDPADNLNRIIGGGTCVFLADGRALYANKEGRFSAVDAATGRVVASAAPVSPKVRGLAVDPSGTYVAVLFEDRAPVLLHAATLRVAAELPGGADPIREIVFSRDGALLAAVRKHSVAVLRLVRP